MMRLTALLLSLVVCLAGCDQKEAGQEGKVVNKQADQQEKVARKQADQEEKAVEAPADQEEKAVNAILKLGGMVKRDENLPGEPVVGISLSKTKVTDSDLKDLKELRGLQELYLGDTQITDAGLKNLKELNGLMALTSAAPRSRTPA